jgi:DNA-nicking Smr family endonuclease
VKAKSLQELAAIRQQLAEQEREREAQLQAQLAAQRLAEQQRHLFARAVGKVASLPSDGRVLLQPPRPSPAATQKQLDDQAVLQESLSDEFDIATLLDVDDQMSFRRPGVGQDVTRKLRKGDWSIQAQLDLHGLRSDEAREALGQFMRQARVQGLRCVRVVHGKGLGSPGKEPVLKAKVQRWLVQKNEVIAFVQARPADGGAGALVVLLAPSKSA